MRTHSVFIKIFLITSFCFLVLSFVFNYFVEDKIYKDICVGILASSLVSLFSSTCGYFTEKRKAMEEFSIISKYLLKKYGDYQDDWSIEEKIKFYISMYNLDYTNFELSFSKIWLIDTKKQEYIYESIYQPIVKVRTKFNDCGRHCKLYSTGVGGSIETIKGMVFETENFFMEYKGFIVEDEAIQSIRNRFLEDIFKELNGEYYEIMYPHCKKKA